jgi:hypothetical protein
MDPRVRERLAKRDKRAKIVDWTPRVKSGATSDP